MQDIHGRGGKFAENLDASAPREGEPPRSHAEQRSVLTPELRQRFRAIVVGFWKGDFGAMTDRTEERDLTLERLGFVTRVDEEHKYLKPTPEGIMREYWLYEREF